MAQTMGTVRTDRRPEADETAWRMTALRQLRLSPGEALQDTVGPLWLLVRSGTALLTTPRLTRQLAAGDAALLPAWARRDVNATTPAVLAIADLAALPAVPAPLVLPAFAARHEGVVALLEACPLDPRRNTSDWARGYAGLLGAALTESRRELALDGPDRWARSTADGDAAVAGVLAELARRPGAQWDLDRMAAAAGISRSSLVQRFRRSLRLSPAEALRQVRMREARRLLSQGTAVTDVAFAVGYNSTAAFSRAFARQHGAAPRRWLAEQHGHLTAGPRGSAPAPFSGPRRPSAPPSASELAPPVLDVEP